MIAPVPVHCFSITFVSKLMSQEHHEMTSPVVELANMNREYFLRVKALIYMYLIQASAPKCSQFSITQQSLMMPNSDSGDSSDTHVIFLP